MSAPIPSRFRWFLISLVFDDSWKPSEEIGWWILHKIPPSPPSKCRTTPLSVSTDGQLYVYILSLHNDACTLVKNIFCGTVAKIVAKWRSTRGGLRTLQGGGGHDITGEISRFYSEKCKNVGFRGGKVRGIADWLPGFAPLLFVFG